MVRTLLTATLVTVIVGFAPIFALYTLHGELAPVSRVEALEVGNPDAPSPPDANWSTIELPNKLCRQDCQTQHKRYRWHADLREPSVLYLPLFDSAVTVMVNGKSIANIGRNQPPISDLTYHPSLVSLPQVADTPSLIEVTVSSLVVQGGRLAPAYVEPESSLIAAYRAARWMSVEIIQSVVLVLLIAALLAVALWCFVERHGAYAWFALLCLAAVVRASGIVVPDWPVDHVIRHWLYISATATVLLSSAGFAAALGVPQKRVQLVAGALTISAIGVSYPLLSHDLYFYWVVMNAAVQAIGMVVIPYVLYRVLRKTRQLDAVLRGAVVGWLLVTVVLVGHDILFARFYGPLLFQLSNLAGLGFIVAFLLLLVARFIDVRRREQDARYRLAIERERLLADMHDTVAGRLAVLIQQEGAAAEPNAALVDSLRSSLRDLRAAMDSLDPRVNTDIALALCHLRAFNQPLFERGRMQLDWSMPDLLKPHPAETVLHAVRIVQEAINNSLRHSGANQLRVTVAELTDELEISIEDDGVGFDPTEAIGRGLGIQRDRAAAAGIDLELISKHGTGSTVRLRLRHPPIYGDSNEPVPA